MDILFDLHTHTIFNDHAYSTIYENIQCAKANGLKGIATTDHSIKLEDSGHYWHFLQLPKVVPPYVNDIRVFSGAEVNIISDNGELDLSDELMSKLDVVIASFHSMLFMPENEKCLINAYEKLAQNPYIDIFGHIDRCPYDFDMVRVIKLAKEHNKLIELNQTSLNNSHYREKSVKLAMLCNKYKIPVVVNTDAHFCTQVGDFTQIKKMLEDIGFDEKLIVNADYDKTMEIFDK